MPIQIIEFTSNNTTLVAANVEDKFLGISLTEVDGLNARRVGIEIKDRLHLLALKTIIDEQLARQK